MHVLTHPFLFFPSCRHCSENRQVAPAAPPPATTTFDKVAARTISFTVERMFKCTVCINEDYESINCHFHFEENHPRSICMQIYANISKLRCNSNATKQIKIIQSTHRIASKKTRIFAIEALKNSQYVQCTYGFIQI